MRKLIRPFAAVVYIAFLAVPDFVISADGAMAQDQTTSPPVKQMALTKKQIEGFLAAQKDMDAVTEKMSDNVPPDPKVTARLESAAKKNGFASYDEYTNVVDNISLVLAGFNPTTKKYIGSDAVIRAQIAQIQADKKMPTEDKKEALAELDNALKSPVPPVENKGNIDLVTKYYDKLADAMGNDQQ
jgi:hydroxymethylpyrimidine pyrophosphatase-like HAD family hydrolase